MAKVQELKIRALTADTDGLAKYMEREARSMGTYQFYREAVQNEIEAGASKVVIDGFLSGDGHMLSRVSGNGSGMSPEKLISHLSTVMKTDKGAANFGIGARIAALPANPAGVTFASKTQDSIGMITLIKQDGAYGIKNWEVEVEDEGGGVHLETADVIEPMSTELAYVKETGTAVILHGDGRSDTWTSGLANQVGKYLAQRYYLFPEGVEVVVHNIRHDRASSSAGSQKVVPWGQTLARVSTHDGEVPFKDIAGLNGVIFWWLLPTEEELKQLRSGWINDIKHGVGSVVDNEIFDHDTIHLTDFGIHYKSVQKRVVILIAVDGAQMDTTRTSVTYPHKASGDKRVTPWKAFGAHFAEHMPDEIDALMSKVIPASSVYTDDMAKKLDKDWMQWIEPVAVIVPSKNGELIYGKESGTGLPKGKSIVHPPKPRPPRPKPKRPKKRLAAHRIGAGNSPGIEKLKPVTPRVLFVPEEDMPDDHPHIYWSSTNGTVFISKGLPPYVREIKRWLEKSQHPMSVVRKAVEDAYSIEYASYIIDANSQRKSMLTDEEIETLKSDFSLYAKALGCQSLTKAVEQSLKAVVKVS